jgi:hypothetical protein
MLIGQFECVARPTSTPTFDDRSERRSHLYVRRANAGNTGDFEEPRGIDPLIDDAEMSTSAKHEANGIR